MQRPLSATVSIEVAAGLTQDLVKVGLEVIVPEITGDLEELKFEDLDAAAVAMRGLVDEVLEKAEAQLTSLRRQALRTEAKAKLAA
jgi:hypothetical protein